MRKIEFAHEILSESRRSTQIYLESGRDFDKVKANMYSVFECYAHGLISWNQVRYRWHSSILEYLNLYADRPDLYLIESNRMLGEYETTLHTHKIALDEYKRVNEQKMTSNIVVKGKLNESQAKDQSNVYFNRRALKESELKDTVTMKTWKRVQESYPNLTSKDELRIRMLTVFEGSTVDTTKLVTTYMSEEPTAISGPMQTSMRPKPRPTNLGNVDSASIDAAVKQALGQTSPRPMPRPANLGNDPQGIGAGSQVAYMDNGAVDGSTRGVDPSEIYSPEQIAILRGEAPPSLAPTTSPRPMPRPTTLKQSANNNIRKEAAAIFDKIKVAANEGYKVLPPMDKERYTEIPGLEGPFTTLSGKVVYYDPKEGAYYDRDSDMYLSNDEYTALNSDYSGMQDERDINVKEADTWSQPMSHPDYMDYKNNPEIASAFEKQRQNWLKTNPWGGDVDDLNDLVNFGNKVNQVGNTKAAATLTKQSMDYFKNNPGRGLGEAAKPDFLDMDKDGNKKEPMKKAVADSKKKVDESALDEAGAFSYGKKPRKGTVAYNAAEQRKKQEKNEKPIEPKDQKVGNAKVTKDKVDEKAKWRSSSAAKKITDPDKDLGMADYDYHHENPRSTGRLKSTADTELSDGSINNRAKSKTNSMGKRKGMVSKADINRVKSNAFNTLNKDKVDEAPLLGPQGKIHRAASADQSDREYASQKSFKDAWTAKNVGKKWPGYSEAGYKHPAYKKEESAVNEAYINTNKDAMQVLSDLRKIGKSMELGQSTYEGNLANKYAEDVWDVYTFIEAKTKGFQNIDSNAKAAIAEMMQLRKMAKGMERDPGASSNRGFANSIVNTLYPVMQYLDSMRSESAVNEAVTLDYSRYMRAHGKKPRDAGMGSSTWMFTTAEFGDPSEDEIFQFQGSFADAKKAAAKWAKSQGEYRFYVME